MHRNLKMDELLKSLQQFQEAIGNDEEHNNSTTEQSSNKFFARLVSFFVFKKIIVHLFILMWCIAKTECIGA